MKLYAVLKKEADGSWGIAVSKDTIWMKPLPMITMKEGEAQELKDLIPTLEGEHRFATFQEIESDEKT